MHFFVTAAAVTSVSLHSLHHTPCPVPPVPFSWCRDLESRLASCRVRVEAGEAGVRAAESVAARHMRDIRRLQAALSDAHDDARMLRMRLDEHVHHPVHATDRGAGDNSGGEAGSGGEGAGSSDVARHGEQTGVRHEGSNSAAVCRDETHSGLALALGAKDSVLNALRAQLSALRTTCATAQRDAKRWREVALRRGREVAVMHNSVLHSLQDVQGERQASDADSSAGGDGVGDEGVEASVVGGSGSGGSDHGGGGVSPSPPCSDASQYTGTMVSVPGTPQEDVAALAVVGLSVAGVRIAYDVCFGACVWASMCMCAPVIRYVLM